MRSIDPAVALLAGLLTLGTSACAHQATPPEPGAVAASDVAAPAIPARAVAAKLADRLAADFVLPEQGNRYAAMLRANAESGKYDALSGLDLARQLTGDLQAVAADGHLRVMFEGQGGVGPVIVIERPAGADTGAPPPEGGPRMVRMLPPPAVEAPRWLAPGIAFVRFNVFPGDTETVAAARAFMEAHADADVIIFDIRSHMGGGMDEMDVIFPWLFAEPARLVSMATRKSVDDAGGSPIAGVTSMRRVEGDPDVVVREHWVTPRADSPLFDAKVFVLTSPMTGSAAEHFALALKRTGRGTLIGSPTYGANHFGGDQDIGGGFTAFIPVGRTYDPDTGEDWEGDGVAPDIAAAPDSALVEALIRSGVSPSDAARLSAEVAPKVPMPPPRAG